MSRARSRPSAATTTPRSTRVSSARRSTRNPIRLSSIRIRPIWRWPRPSSSRTRPISSIPSSPKSATTSCSVRTRYPTTPTMPRATPTTRRARSSNSMPPRSPQKAAALKAAQINLDYTNIVSPVNGTVVSRNVTAGQTVAASFQTPTLFLIATDLTKMQVDTNVSESDIAGAVEGANASFTVDAFPKRIFHGLRGPGPAGPHQRAERHHLRRRGHGRQFRPAAQAGDDGDRQDRHGPGAQRPQSPVAGAAVHAGGRRQARGRPTMPNPSSARSGSSAPASWSRSRSPSGSMTTASRRSNRAI